MVNRVLRQRSFIRAQWGYGVFLDRQLPLIAMGFAGSAVLICGLGLFVQRGRCGLAAVVLVKLSVKYEYDSLLFWSRHASLMNPFLQLFPD